MGAGDIRIPGPCASDNRGLLALLGMASGPLAAPLPVPTCLYLWRCCSAACVFSPRAFGAIAGALEVTAIDVGQGDSLLLVTPMEKPCSSMPEVALRGRPGVANFEIGEEVVSAYLVVARYPPA